MIESLNDQQIISLVVLLTIILLAAIGYLSLRLQRINQQSGTSEARVEVKTVMVEDERYPMLLAQLASVEIEIEPLRQLVAESDPELTPFIDRIVDRLEQLETACAIPSPVVEQEQQQQLSSAEIDQQRIDQLEQQSKSIRSDLQNLGAKIGPLATVVGEVQSLFYQSGPSGAGREGLGEQKREYISICVDNLKQLSSMVTDASSEMEKASQQVHQLEVDSENVGGVLDGIGEIAEQTNLLALNAAIEAARAGDQGRGFAVVADEVRTLAQRSQDFTGEIREKVEAWKEISRQAMSSADASRTKMTEGQAQLHSFSESLHLVANEEEGGDEVLMTQLNGALSQVQHSVSDLQSEIKQLQQRFG